MDTITSYLDNIFASLPRTEPVLRARRELQATMEEKYRALKSEGKSENEAVGTVISEFGNIDEIVATLGIRREDSGRQLPMLSDEDVQGYLAVTSQSSVMIGAGVMLCILGAAMLILFGGLSEQGLMGDALTGGAGSILGLIVMFLFIAVAVGLFIYGGMRMERYKHLENGFALSERTRQDVQRRLDQYSATFTAAIVIGVGLCILSPLPLFLSAVFPALAGPFAVTITLAIVAVAVFIFIRAGMRRDAYSRLLQIEEYAPEQVARSKVTDAVASVVFPLAALTYLYLGFFRGLWHPGWVIFPAVGILFGIFSAVYGIVSRGDR